jgi:hypothetical protein
LYSDWLGPALELQDLHVLVGEALGLLQQRVLGAATDHPPLPDPTLGFSPEADN